MIKRTPSYIFFLFLEFGKILFSAKFAFSEKTLIYYVILIKFRTLDPQSKCVDYLSPNWYERYASLLWGCNVARYHAGLQKDL